MIHHPRLAKGELTRLRKNRDKALEEQIKIAKNLNTFKPKFRHKQHLKAVVKRITYEIKKENGWL